MKNKLGLKPVILISLLFCLSTSSCVWSAVANLSELNFDVSGLPEQDKNNSYMSGRAGTGQTGVKFAGKPLAYLYTNCKQARLMSFCPSVLIYLPPVIPVFFLDWSGNDIWGERLKLYFDISGREENYSFDVEQVALAFDDREEIKPEKVEEESVESVVNVVQHWNSANLIRRKGKVYIAAFDIKCEDLKNLQKGRLLIRGLKYHGRRLDWEVPFYWDSGFSLVWGFLGS